VALLLTGLLPPAVPKSWGQADGDLQVFGFFQNAFIHQTEYTATPPFNGESARNSFSVQQHNLFFRKDLDRNWRAFVNHKGFNSFSSSRRWGSLNLEEAWVRYRANSNLNEINNRTPLLPYIIRPLVYDTPRRRPGRSRRCQSLCAASSGCAGAEAGESVDVDFGPESR
jgi:hypothetical protein